MLNRLKLISLLVFIVFLTAYTGVAGEKHYTLSNGEKDFYFGHISYLPDDVGTKNPEVLRNGLTPGEEVQLNFPVVPGDVIVTYDRPCEIQFDSGTIIRLDVNSRLKVETVLAQTLSSEEKLSSLFLEKGRMYLMYTAYNSWEIFQLVTPSAALKMKNHTVLVVAQDEPVSVRISVRQGSAKVLFGPDEKNLKAQTIKKGENVIIGLTPEIQRVTAFSDLDGFIAWNEKINREFVDLHKGVTPLPKPVQKLPAAVFYFAQYYGNQYGEWVWDNLYGYVWRPYYNDIYPWGNWSPYVYGRWSSVNGSLYWVPEEPWGWVPYHLGIWQWDKKLGWVWIPGSVFAPAWVDWYFYYGFFSWRPWTLDDFLYFGYYGLSPVDYYWNSYWNSGYPGSLPGTGEANWYQTKITKDQLKKRTDVAVPSDYKKIVTNLAKAVEKNDSAVLERISGKLQPVTVRGEELASKDLKSRIITSRDKIIEEIKAPSSASSGVKTTAGHVSSRFVAAEFLKWQKLDSAREASSGIAVQGNLPAAEKSQAQKPDNHLNYAVPKNGQLDKGQLRSSGQPQNSREISRPVEKQVMRFRDWNPDIRVARETGLRIIYDSSRNSIVAPDIGLSSKEAREMHLRITPQGVVQPAGVGYISSDGSYVPSSSSPNSPTPVNTKVSAAQSSSSGHSNGNASNAAREKH